MTKQVVWPKDQIAEAKRRGDALFSVAISGCHLTKEQNPKSTGQYEHYGPVDHELARKMFFFAHACLEGMDPAKAFKEQFGGG